MVGPDYVLLGNCVVVNHGEGLTSLYLHLSRIDVQEGQVVQPGQVLGAVGNDRGVGVGPHRALRHLLPRRAG